MAEVVFLSVGSVENEHSLVNKQGQVEGSQELLSDLEMLVPLVACDGLSAAEAPLSVGQQSEEIVTLFARPALGFGDAGSLARSGVAMHPFPQHLLYVWLLIALQIVPYLLDQCSSAFAHLLFVCDQQVLGGLAVSWLLQETV